MGNRWRALTEKERGAYEEKARIETIKEAQQRAADLANQKHVQQLSHSPLQALQPSHQQIQSNNNNAMPSPHTNHINHILANQPQTQQQPYQLIATSGNATMQAQPVFLNAQGQQTMIIHQSGSNGLMTQQGYEFFPHLYLKT